MDTKGVGLWQKEKGDQNEFIDIDSLLNIVTQELRRVLIVWMVG